MARTVVVSHLEIHLAGVRLTGHADGTLAPHEAGDAFVELLDLGVVTLE